MPLAPSLSSKATSQTTNRLFKMSANNEPKLPPRTPGKPQLPALTTQISLWLIASSLYRKTNQCSLAMQALDEAENLARNLSMVDAKIRSATARFFKDPSSSSPFSQVINIPRSKSTSSVRSTSFSSKNKPAQLSGYLNSPELKIWGKAHVTVRKVLADIAFEVRRIPFIASR